MFTGANLTGANLSHAQA
ncbi:pentapeptide repeat-containing protein [Nostoc sp. LEGE 12450]|nr:pentapeptide repeat-containing protein [Nostoc sp. LEGE 12450]